MSATIMIVDDAAFMWMMLKDILTKNGFTVVGEAEAIQSGAKDFVVKPFQAERVVEAVTKALK